MKRIILTGGGTAGHVTPNMKDGTPVGMDAKANAGTYKVKLVYTDDNDQMYTVDEKTFTINQSSYRLKPKDSPKHGFQAPVDHSFQKFCHLA